VESLQEREFPFGFSSKPSANQACKLPDGGFELLEAGAHFLKLEKNLHLIFQSFKMPRL